MSAAAPFEIRAERAARLAGSFPTSADALRFAASLFRLQGRFAAILASRHAEAPLSGHPDDDYDRFFDLAEGLFAFAESEGPAAMAEIARSRRADERETARFRLLLYWAGERETAEDVLSRALLRPYVETLARAGVSPDRPRREGHCPFCGGRPVVAVRETPPEAAEPVRRLACALCGTGWSFPRHRCPSCFEEDSARLSLMHGEIFPSVRLEVCESCRLYVKSIDLTLDPRQIPDVDDIASLPMDLWARGEGYGRIEPGWAGM